MEAGIRQDMKEMEAGIRQDMKTMEAGIRQDMKEMEAGIRQDMKEMEAGIRRDMSVLDDRITGLDHRVTDLNDQVLKLSDRVLNVELHLEQVTDPKIEWLAENYLPAAKRYEKATEKIEAVASDVDVLKSVVREHSEKLQMIS